MESLRLTPRAALLRDGAGSAGAGLVVLGYLYLALRMQVYGMGAPLRFSHDSLVFLTQIKATVDNGWWWFNPAIGAPQGFEALLFPSNSNVDQALVWILRWFWLDAMSVANATWMLMVGLSAVTASWSLRSLGASRLVAASCGVLFALSPYAMYRNLEHMNLVTYLVPPVCALALHVAAADMSTLPWRRCWGLIAGVILLGFNYIYYAFFGCFVLVVSILIAWTSKRVAVVRQGAAILLILISCAALNLLPSFDAYRRLGVPVTVGAKSPAESEQYGLKIRHLVSPVFQHPFPLFERWGQRESDARFPLDTENLSARLGLLTAVGFLSALALVILRMPAAAGTPVSFSLASGQLIVAMLLLATIGGFGSLFGLLITPDIRGWNRICPFIAFMSLVPVASAFDHLRNRFRNAALLLVPVLALGAWDQSAALNSLIVPRQANADEFASVKAVVDRLAAALPRQSLILQLPFAIYLRETGTLGMLPYDHFKPYLASSHSLRWNYPAMTNAQFKWQQAAAVLSVPDLASAAASEGFSAVLVDTAAYSDAGQEVMTGLRVAGARTIVGQGRYRAFSLAEVPRGPAVEERRRTTAAADVCEGGPLYFIDTLNDKPHTQGNALVLTVGDQLDLSGWFVIPSKGRAALAMDVVVDGITYPALYGFDRPDVATHFSDPDYRPSGFRVIVPANELTAGTHSIQFRAVAADRSCYVETPAFSVTIR